MNSITRKNRFTQVDKSSEAKAFSKVKAKSEKGKEDSNDCAVIALSLATETDYDKVHKLCETHGRLKKQGTKMTITRKVLKDLGFKARLLHTETFIDKYPKPHSNLKNVTTHHLDRFPEAFDSNKVYLFRTKNHILCVKGGKVQDWTRGRSKHVREIYEITKA